MFGDCPELALNVGIEMKKPGIRRFKTRARSRDTTNNLEPHLMVDGPGLTRLRDSDENQQKRDEGLMGCVDSHFHYPSRRTDPGQSWRCL